MRIWRSTCSWCYGNFEADETALVYRPKCSICGDKQDWCFDCDQAVFKPGEPRQCTKCLAAGRLVRML